jgi:hypothetical protein
MQQKDKWTAVDTAGASLCWIGLLFVAWWAFEPVPPVMRAAIAAIACVPCAIGGWSLIRVAFNAMFWRG